MNQRYNRRLGQLEAQAAVESKRKPFTVVTYDPKFGPPDLAGEPMADVVFLLPDNGRADRDEETEQI